MTKSEALSKFGSKQAEQIKLMAEMLGIERAAIYQWGEKIPARRACEIALMERDGILPVRHPTQAANR